MLLRSENQNILQTHNATGDSTLFWFDSSPTDTGAFDRTWFLFGTHRRRHWQLLFVGSTYTSLTEGSGYRLCSHLGDAGCSQNSNMNKICICWVTMGFFKSLNLAAVSLEVWQISHSSSRAATFEGCCLQSVFEGTEGPPMVRSGTPCQLLQPSAFNNLSLRLILELLNNLLHSCGCSIFHYSPFSFAEENHVPRRCKTATLWQDYFFDMKMANRELNAKFCDGGVYKLCLKVRAPSKHQSSAACVTTHSSDVRTRCGERCYTIAARRKAENKMFCLCPAAEGSYIKMQISQGAVPKLVI